VFRPAQAGATVAVAAVAEAVAAAADRIIIDQPFIQSGPRKGAKSLTPKGKLLFESLVHFDGKFCPWLLNMG
jgi:hypothetical protein